MEEICVLLARHRELVTATVDDIATAAAVAQMQPVEVAVDVIVPVPVVYKSCPDLPTDDMLYNLLASLVVETTANLIICAELYRLDKARASEVGISTTVKRNTINTIKCIFIFECIKTWIRKARQRSGLKFLGQDVEGQEELPYSGILSYLFSCGNDMCVCHVGEIFNSHDSQYLVFYSNGQN